jgi:hypothetical protein
VPLFLAAAAVLAFEVLLTRVFSVVMWYHFASMAIAVTMFGLSAGGLLPFFPALRRGGPAEGGAAEGLLSPRARLLLLASSAAFSLVPYGVLLWLSHSPLEGAKLLSVFHQPYFEPFRTSGGAALRGSEGFRIALLLLLFALPFVGAGALFAEAFSREGKEGRTYLLVMGGSAAGVLAYLLFLRSGSGPAAFLFVAALFALSAAALAPPRSPSRLLLGAAALLLVAGGGAEAKHGFAEIRFVRGAYEPGLLWTKWDANSRVAVYPASDEEAYRAWGISPAYEGPLPEQVGMVVDDTGYTALFGTGKDPASLAVFRHNVASVPYLLKAGGKALVVGPGGGKDILCAVASGDYAVTAVEVNPLVVEAADEVFGAFTGRPYSLPKVRKVVAEGRNFLASDPGRYDVIQMTQVFGRIPPSAGAFTMSEDHLYTREGIGEYLSHLTDDGVLSVTRFAYERRVWRLLPMAMAALSEMGASDPARHLAVVRDRGLVNVLVRRTPWTAEALSALARTARGLRFSVVLDPDHPGTGLPAELVAGKARPAGEIFDFSPPTDDRPFFYYTLRPSAFLSAVSLRGGEFDDRSVSMLRGFFLGAAGLCALFLLLPALWLGRAGYGRPALRPTLYMFSVGVAFIVWEIVVIKRLTLLFGLPVLTFAAGLTLVLAFSGLGGYWAGKRRAVPAPGALAAAVLLASAWLLLLGPAVARLAGEGMLLRVAAAAAFSAPPAFLMGLFFPSGLRLFRGDGGGSVPFLYAANGAASVLGAVLTQLLALNLGYRAVTIFGAVLYLLCAFLLAGRRRDTT